MEDITIQFEYNEWYCDINEQMLYSIEQIKPTSAIIFETKTSKSECLDQLLKYLK